jgi:hypothetical protein
MCVQVTGEYVTMTAASRIMGGCGRRTVEPWGETLDSLSDYYSIYCAQLRLITCTSCHAVVRDVIWVERISQAYLFLRYG